MKNPIEKFNKNYTEVVKILDINFSDMKIGQKMLISSPKSIANYINNIPFGKKRSIKQMRLDLAQKANADNTCPLTTGIFLRIAIEASLADVYINNKPQLPFWRVISIKDNISKKLSISKTELLYLLNLES